MARINMPTYIKIANDIAAKIFKGQLKIGDKLKGRSILSSEYNVSPETIRKSMKLLEEKGVVIVNQGSGIIIKSSENAYKFLESFQEKENISSIRKQIKELLEQRKVIEKDLVDLNEKIIDYSYRFHVVSKLDPVEVVIPETSKLIGKTVSQCGFWQNTGGTIVGIIREDDVIISPGPNFIFYAHDKLLIVGNIGVEQKSIDYVEK
ncbi:TrkA C-terminal domain-containing protein [Clostridium sp. DL1XJH146]